MTTDEIKVNLIALNCVLATHNHFDEPEYDLALRQVVKLIDAFVEINDVLDVPAMTETDALDEIIEIINGFKAECGVSE